MFKNIPGNVRLDFRECPGVLEDSMVCPKRLLGTFKKIWRNYPKDSMKCSKRIRRMLLKISRNVQEDSWGLNMDLFCEILLFLSQFAIKLLHNHGENNY